MHQTNSLDTRPAFAAPAADQAEERTRARIWAERLYAERRRRDALFPDELFGEPAWDLLLAMFIARDRGQAMILCKAYHAAGVSDTTGRRLLDRMEEEGLITRRRAPRSRKMRIVEMTELAVERLTDFLAHGL
ncbi:transcriptional regulator [Allosphingosinicella sp.]|uniref:transcriptional regulator n=1 Tax=Allosphingosinicella sp. TaxID=2823234 RepID=UPI0037849763